jgi:urease accessory protein
VRAPDALGLSRAAYHLGNRHIPLQIEALRLAYLHDHVLDQMLRELGFQLSFAAERFEPEAGAYGGHAHAHLHRPSQRPRPSSDRDHDHGDHEREHQHEQATRANGA